MQRRGNTADRVKQGLGLASVAGWGKVKSQRVPGDLPKANSRVARVTIVRRGCGRQRRPQRQETLFLLHWIHPFTFFENLETYITT